MNFWDVVKETSAQGVRNEVKRLFVLALAGDEEAVAVARAQVLGPNPTPDVEAATEPFLFCVSPPYNAAQAERMRHADLLVSLPGGPRITEYRPADTLLVEAPERIVPQVLAHRPDLRVPLGRRLPGFRKLAAEQVVRDVSRVNAEFAAVSAVSGSIPFLAPLFPAMAGTDMFVLTKNQVIMLFRLAAIYGEDLDLGKRSREVIPIIAGAFGWRAIAREFAGLLPGGLGIPLKASIAYTGTYAVGRAAELALDEGREPTRREMRRIYEDGAALARELADRIKERLPKGKRAPQAELPEPQAHLPVAEVIEDEAETVPAENPT